jgi:rhomboid protease GluP
MNMTPDPRQYPEPPRPQTVQVSLPAVKPYATYGLLGLTVFVYLLQLAGHYLLGQDLVTALGMKVNDYIRAGQLWRLITPMFLHDDTLPYGLLHIGFNMYALVIFGRGLEARYGHGRFVLLYFLSAFSGNVLSFLLTPNPSLGASTAIFGLLTAEGVFLLQNKKILGSRVNRALMNVLYMALINLFIGFTTSGVDNFGHIGGMRGGLAFAWFGGPRWKVEGLYPSFHLVDEREGHGAITGTAVVLLIFIPLTILGWIFPR